MKSYPGAKTASGVAQKLISVMPPHETFIELFAGNATLSRVKRPSRFTMLLDVNLDTVKSLQQHPWHRGMTVKWADAMHILPAEPALQASSTLAYADPPYLWNTRSQRHLNMYGEHEFQTEEEHWRLLTALDALPCMVMVSGYYSLLYMNFFCGRKKWWWIKYPAMTRGGIRHEYCWMNYPAPAILHDPRFVGGDYRQRERIKRKRRTWATRFAAMPPGERQIIAEELQKIMQTTPAAAVSQVATGESPCPPSTIADPNALPDVGDRQPSPAASH